jgi:hypothetical protein
MKNLLITRMDLSKNKEERLAFALNIVCSCALISLLLLMPELDAAFSWTEG